MQEVAKTCQTRPNGLMSAALSASQRPDSDAVPRYANERVDKPSRIFICPTLMCSEIGILNAFARHSVV